MSKTIGQRPDHPHRHTSRRAAGARRVAGVDPDHLASSAVGRRPAPVRGNCERGRTPHGYSHHNVGPDPSI
jgi:hypothetical protein